MIIQIYAGLIVSAFLFLFYGYYSKTDLYRIFGSFLLIASGFAITPYVSNLFGNVQYVSGTTATTVVTVTTTVNNYAVYSDVTIGTFLILYGVFSFIIILFDRRDE